MREHLCGTPESIYHSDKVPRSANLYADSAHFLFELIQNADDNEYAVPTPTLNITYKESFRGRRLRIDCNEVGFSKSNVESICSISESSKIGNGRRGKYIGEKGMGFKSVFAGSEVVWIHSGYYSFKFINNDSQDFGMIVPHWDRFPQKTLPGHTSILLELTPGRSTESLVGKLRSMNPSFLMFLRSLRQINIELRNTRPVILKRRDSRLEGSKLKTVTVYRGTESTEYAMFQQQVSKLPHDPRRKGVTQTELVLAFPLGEPSKSTNRNVEHVHAFLPIRDYGFKVSCHSAR